MASPAREMEKPVNLARCFSVPAQGPVQLSGSSSALRLPEEALATAAS